MTISVDVGYQGSSFIVYVYVSRTPFECWCEWRGKSDFPFHVVRDSPRTVPTPGEVERTEGSFEGGLGVNYGRG